MLFPVSYTPFSYIDYTVGAGGITTLTTDFTFNIYFISSEHIKVYIKDSSSDLTWTEISSANFTVSGTSGAATVTLEAGAPARVNGNLIRFLRQTPNSISTLVVDFMAGSLTTNDLDVSTRQNLFITQERQDQLQAIGALVEDMYALIVPGFTLSAI